MNELMTFKLSFINNKNFTFKFQEINVRKVSRIYSETFLEIAARSRSYRCYSPQRLARDSARIKFQSQDAVIMDAELARSREKVILPTCLSHVLVLLLSQTAASCDSGEHLPKIPR
jgi:hypothetical protein